MFDFRCFREYIVAMREIEELLACPDVIEALAEADIVAEDELDRAESRLKLHYPYLYGLIKPISFSNGKNEITLG